MEMTTPLPNPQPAIQNLQDFYFAMSELASCRVQRELVKLDRTIIDVSDRWEREAERVGGQR